jgi:hypothetical protein
MHPLGCWGDTHRGLGAVPTVVWRLYPLRIRDCIHRSGGDFTNGGGKYIQSGGTLFPVWNIPLWDSECTHWGVRTVLTERVRTEINELFRLYQTPVRIVANEAMQN